MVSYIADTVHSSWVWLETSHLSHLHFPYAPLNSGKSRLGNMLHPLIAKRPLFGSSAGCPAVKRKQSELFGYWGSHIFQFQCGFQKGLLIQTQLEHTGASQTRPASDRLMIGFAYGKLWFTHVWHHGRWKLLKWSWSPIYTMLPWYHLLKPRPVRLQSKLHKLSCVVPVQGHMQSLRKIFLKRDRSHKTKPKTDPI